MEIKRNNIRSHMYRCLQRNRTQFRSLGIHGYHPVGKREKSFKGRADKRILCKFLRLESYRTAQRCLPELLSTAVTGCIITEESVRNCINIYALGIQGKIKNKTIIGKADTALHTC